MKPFPIIKRRLVSSYWISSEKACQERMAANLEFGPDAIAFPEQPIPGRDLDGRGASGRDWPQRRFLSAAWSETDNDGELNASSRLVDDASTLIAPERVPEEPRR
jgi:hypothetical protein